MSELNIPIKNSNGDLLEIKKDKSGYTNLVLTPSGSNQSLPLVLTKSDLVNLIRVLQGSLAALDSAS